MGKRLLLIDDDIGANPKDSLPGTMALMWYYAEALRERGYELTETNNIDRAVEILASGSFDLILLDIMMPPGKTLAGADTASGMRTGVVFADGLVQSHPDTPIIILTMVANPSAFNALLRKRNVKRILQKSDFPPSLVADEVHDVIGD
jgi:CheY-like chemotaxis protein